MEEEGILFEEGGKRNRIREDFFVDTAAVSKAGFAPPTVDAAKRAKRRKTEKTAVAVQLSATTKRTSTYFETVDEETLKHEILNVLEKRNPKTC